MNNDLVASGQLTAIELHCKLEVADKALLLQEKELQGKQLICEKSIMSRDLSQLDGTAQQFYQLQKELIWPALEQEIEQNQAVLFKVIQSSFPFFVINTLSNYSVAGNNLQQVLSLDDL